MCHTQEVRVAVYAIALNEVAHVERFLAATSEADLVVVADTGSSDGTVEALRNGGAVVHEITINPWRFDDARNAALALVPTDIDVCFSLDLDELPNAGWREQLEFGWGDATRGRYRFVASHQPDGSDGVVGRQGKIHTRRGYRWVYACHEALKPDRLKERTQWLDLEVHHWPDQTKSRGQYLDLLEVCRSESPSDSRVAHLLGREYLKVQRWADAEAELIRYADLSPVWPDERAESFRMIGIACSMLERPDDELQWLERAAAEPSGHREPLVALAKALHNRQDWKGCYTAATSALAIEAEPMMTRLPWAWGPLPHRLASTAARHLGLAEESARHAEVAAGFSNA